MNFTHTDVEVTGAAVAIVALNHQANVMLLDPPNYEAYCARRLFLYMAGGWTTRSPARLRIPSPGLWHIVIDLYGAPGHIVASVRIVDLRSGDPSLRRRRTQPVPALRTAGSMFPGPGEFVDGQLAPRRRVLAERVTPEPPPKEKKKKKARKKSKK